MKNTEWPWDKIKPGEVFFVPCLSPEEVVREGFAAAFEAGHFRIYAVLAIHDNLFGVAFGKRPTSHRLRRYEYFP